MRILCLDMGSKTIGVAMSDPMGWISQPVKTIQRKTLQSDLSELAEIIQEKEVKKIIIGLPLNMNGTEGPQAQKVHGFVKELEKKVPGIPILLLDERLSTVAAERSLIEADVSRSKRKEVINHMAAAFILQGYLDTQRAPENLPEQRAEDLEDELEQDDE